MKAFYLIFAAAVFSLFCFLEYRGTSMDRSQRLPAPQYYSYRGGSSGGGGVWFAGGGTSHK